MSSTPERDALIATLFAFRVHDLLYDISAGLIEVTPDLDPNKVYAGDVTYHTDNGWIIVVFNDCNEFDYIESITTPEGHVLGWDSPEPIGTLIHRWRPPHYSMGQTIWGINPVHAASDAGRQE